MNKKLVRWLKSPYTLCKHFIIKILNEPFVKVTCTVIAGLLGWWLGVQYQDKNWKEQYNLSMLESDRKQAEEIFNEINRLMDDRHYKTTRLVSAYFQHDSIKIERNRESLILELEEWNANKHRIFSLLDGYFGKNFTAYYINNIQNPFVETGNEILKDKPKSHHELKSIRQKLDKIDQNIPIFNNMMLNAIKQNKVGRFSEK